MWMDPVQRYCKVKCYLVLTEKILYSEATLITFFYTHFLNRPPHKNYIFNLGFSAQVRTPEGCLTHAQESRLY